MKYKVLFIFIITFSLGAMAQDVCFNPTMNVAKAEYNKGNYTRAKELFQEAKGCYDMPKNGKSLVDEWIKKCNEGLTSTPPKQQTHNDTYITVNGQKEINIGHPVQGKSEYISVSTDADSWETTHVPSWCIIENKSLTGFRLKTLSNNNSLQDQNDYFEIRTPQGHTAHINVIQQGNPNYKAATIKEVTISNNEDVNGEEGLCVHISFDIIGMRKEDIQVACYFQDSVGNALVDKNEKYATKGSRSHVAVSENIKPSDDNTTYSDLQIKIPYRELHLLNVANKKLEVTVVVWDHSSTKSKELTRKGGIGFICTPKETVKAATIRNISISYHHYEAISDYFGYARCLHVHVTCDVRGFAKGGRVVCHVYDSTGKPLEFKHDWKYHSYGETSIDPQKDTATYQDLEIAIPYDGLATDWSQIENKKLKVEVEINAKDAKGYRLVEKDEMAFIFFIPKAKIETVTVSNYEMVNGEEGLCVHVNCDIMGLKGKSGWVSCYFYDLKEKALIDKNGKYAADDHHVLATTNFTASQDTATYQDLQINIPYSELHLSKIKNKKLKVYVVIWDRGCKSSGPKSLCSYWKDFVCKPQ